MTSFELILLQEKIRLGQRSSRVGNRLPPRPWTRFP